MLPVSYFERISGAWRTRMCSGSRERRKGVRVDMRISAAMHLFRSEVVGDAARCRLREISRKGGSLLTSAKARPGQDFVIVLSARSDGSEQALWCRTQRCLPADDLFVVGFTFRKILCPDQALREGIRVDRLVWLDVDGDREPADPFLEEREAA